VSLLYFLQQCLNAVQVSCFYALLAVAYVLVHGVVDRINLAFGAIAMWGAYLTIGGIAVIAGTTVDIPVAMLPLAVIYAVVGTSALGLVIARMVVIPLSLERPLAMLIATIGLAIVLEEVMRLASGSRELYLAPILADTLIDWPNAVFTIRISIIQAVVFAISLGLAVLLALFVRYHRFGRLWRACAQDIRMVALLGIDPRPTIATTIVIGAALASTSGIMLAIYYGSVSFYMGTMLGLKSLYVAVIGGLGSLTGAITGAFALGFFEAMWSAYFPGDYRDVASFAALTFLLILRPGGLLAPAAEAYERV
jgi:branched-chain amino acid transport system permease protein